MKLKEYQDLIDLRYRRFIQELIVNGFNTTQAYKKVYNINNDNSASTMGWRLLQNVKVKRLLAQALAIKQRKYGMDKKQYEAKTLEKAENCKKESTGYAFWQLYGQLNGWLIDKKSIETKDTTEDSYRKALKAHTDRGRELVPDDAIDVEEDKSIENID